jgi:hypothetical protein
MPEAFVKTFKRDYVYGHDGPDARTVLAQLPRWFEDYNEIHPHKALQLKSPREFIRSHQPAECRQGKARGELRGLGADSSVRLHKYHAPHSKVYTEVYTDRHGLCDS